MSIFRVVAGEHDLSKISGLEQNMDVNGFMMHPDYNKKTSENDIALIHVKTNLVPFKICIQSYIYTLLVAINT